MTFLNFAKSTLEEAVITTALVGAGMKFGFGVPLNESIETPLGNMNTYVTVLSSAFVSDMLARALQDKVLDYINDNEQLKKLDMAVVPLLVGGTLFTVMYLMNGAKSWQVFVLGAGSAIVGKYVKNSIPYM